MHWSVSLKMFVIAYYIYQPFWHKHGPKRSLFIQRLQRLVLKIPQTKLEIRESQNLASTWGEQQETGIEENPANSVLWANSLPLPHVRVNVYSVNIKTILFQAFPVDLPPAGSVWRHECIDIFQENDRCVIAFKEFMPNKADKVARLRSETQTYIFFPRFLLIS